MPTKEDLIKELDKEYIKARKEHGAKASEIYISLKKQIVKGNVRAIGLQVKLDDQMPADKKELSGPGGAPLIPPTDPREKELLKKLADKLIEEEKQKVRGGS